MKITLPVDLIPFKNLEQTTKSFSEGDLICKHKSDLECSKQKRASLRKT